MQSDACRMCSYLCAARGILVRPHALHISALADDRHVHIGAGAEIVEDAGANGVAHQLQGGGQEGGERGARSSGCCQLVSSSAMWVVRVRAAYLDGVLLAHVLSIPGLEHGLDQSSRIHTHIHMHTYIGQIRLRQG